MARYLRRVETIVPRRSAGFGGKAKNLAALARAGFPVPAAWALPGSTCAEFLAHVLPDGDRLAPLLALDPADVDPARLEAIASRVRSAPMPRPLSEALLGAFEALRRDGAPSVAVRSSSTLEDSEAASGAGMHATFLEVRDDDALLDAVRACWASLFSERALSYLRARGEPAEAASSVGVVVQAMVPADVSGVLFTANPLTGDDSEVVVNAAYGLGSAVVDGRVSVDTLRIDKATGLPRDRILGDKALRTVVDPAGGVRDEAVPEHLRVRLCVDDATVERLVDIGLRIESHFGDARDVEWSLVGDTLYVLQARPITTGLSGSPRRWTRRRTGGGERARIVWSNVNVGEALPGVATPLTWSVASDFSELGFRRAFGALGCSVPRDAELVGNFRGRIYLNLTEFMAIASQVPGLRPKTLLSLGGGGEVERLEADLERRGRIGFIARLPMTASRFARENYRIGERVKEFEAYFADEDRRIGHLDLRILSSLALAKTLQDVMRLLDASGAIMLTCYGNLLSSVVALRAVLKVVAGDRAEALQRDLFTGLADVESAAPGMSLWHIAEMARADAPSRDLLLREDPASLRVEALPEGPTRRALERFLEAYGHRGAREAEIAAPRWAEDPSLLFATLAIHLRRPPGVDKPIDVERRLRGVREQAMAELERRLPIAGRSALRHLVALVQRFTRMRERLRDYVVRVLGMIRRVALDASRRIEVREPAAGPDAAFYLTLAELGAVLRGDHDRVAALVDRRRRGVERNRAMPDPPDTFVGFPPPVPEPPPSRDLLEGLAASAGRCEGLARRLDTAADAASLQAGEILVASCADVGWSPLFLVAGAVVTDLGGPLSHASIVLREYGVPAVVNVKVGMRLIETGDRLIVDGDEGTVRIVARAHEGPVIAGGDHPDA